MSHVGFVHSARTGRLRSIVITDNDSELNGHRLANGEAMLVIDASVYVGLPDINTAQSLLSGAIGKVPSGDRYVSVDSGNNVLAIHFADPFCGDVSPYRNSSLVPSDDARPGDLFIAGTLLRFSPAISRKRPSRQRNRPQPFR